MLARREILKCFEMKIALNLVCGLMTFHTNELCTFIHRLYREGHKNDPLLKFVLMTNDVFIMI